MMQLDLTQADIDALCARFSYATFVPDPDGTGPPNQRRAVPNPVTPQAFAESVIVAFVERTTDEYIGQESAKTAARAAVDSYRQQHPRKP